MARLGRYGEQADARCEDLRHQLARAEGFARSLHGHLARLTGAASADGSGAEATR